MAAVGQNHLKNLSLGRCGFATGLSATDDLPNTKLSLCNGGVATNIKLSQFSFQKTNNQLSGDTIIGPSEVTTYTIETVVGNIFGSRYLARIGRLDNPNLGQLFVHGVTSAQASSNVNVVNRGATNRTTVNRTAFGTDNVLIVAIMFPNSDISTDTSSQRVLSISVNILGSAPP